MLHIIICEDDVGQRTYIESAISKHIAAGDYEMKLALSSDDPVQVLAHTKAYPDKRRLYLLDIDLQHDEMDGIELGAKIREADPLAKIVFITTHSELAYLTFQHKISAQDYIVKGRPQDIKARVSECIAEAYKLYLKEKNEQMKYFKVDANGEVWNIPHDDMLFFETHVSIRHRVILHTENGKIDFRGFLSEIEKLVPEFYRCHKSYLLNASKISYIDKLAKEAVMSNGMRVHIAQKKMSGLTGIVGDSTG